MRFSPVTFRPLFGRVLSVITAAIVAASLAGYVVAGDGVGLLRYGWLLLLISAVAFALFWLPSLHVAADAVTVRNVFSTVRVPWPAIQRIDTKYALTLYTPDGSIAVWASPAPNRYASQSAVATDTRAAARDGETAIRPGDLLSTASGAAAYVIRTHWEELRRDGHLDNPVLESGAMRRDIHWVTIAVIGALSVATVLGFTL